MGPRNYMGNSDAREFSYENRAARIYPFRDPQGDLPTPKGDRLTSRPILLAGTPIPHGGLRAHAQDWGVQRGSGRPAGTRTTRGQVSSHLEVSTRPAAGRRCCSAVAGLLLSPPKIIRAEPPPLTGGRRLRSSVTRANRLGGLRFPGGGTDRC